MTKSQKNISKSKRLAINMIATFISFTVSFGISFFLTPFITRTMGEEAYGFITLGNNFVNYAKIVTSALNALAARFITVSFYEKKEKDAHQYFSSVLISNVFLTGVLSFVASAVIIWLPNIVKISPELVNDIRLLWIFLFGSFFLTLITSVFSVAPFLKNRVDLSAYRDIINNILRAILLICLFSFLPTRAWYYGVAALIASVYLAIANYSLKEKLVPELKVNKEDFSFKKVKTLLSTGMWSSVNALSLTLSEGLDLLISNLFISSTAMGVLAIAKTVPHAISSMVSTMQSVFVPSFTISFAKNDGQLVDDIKKSIKIMNLLSSFPIVILIVLGRPFFNLWVPEQDERVLYILALLTVGTLIVTATIKPLYAVYTATNHPKGEALSTLIVGVLNVVIVFSTLTILPKELLDDPQNPIGLYVISGVSSVLGILRAFTFTPIYAAYCLKIKKTTFYPAIIRSIISTITTSILAFLATSWFRINSWFRLICAGLICCIVVLLMGYIIILDSSQRKQFLTAIKKRIS